MVYYCNICKTKISTINCEKCDDRHYCSKKCEYWDYFIKFHWLFCDKRKKELLYQNGKL